MVLKWTSLMSEKQTSVQPRGRLADCCQHFISLWLVWSLPVLRHHIWNERTLTRLFRFSSDGVTLFCS